MPGGTARAYVRSARCCSRSPRRSTASPCCTHIGPDGAGHFVKMVHNGIEYADMQLIAEAYDLLRTRLG
jgi:6-phosphogluconate dehydrogenase